MSAADPRFCVACGRETADRYFANAGSTGIGDDARSLPPPVPLCRTCKPIRVGDATSLANNTPVDDVVVAPNGHAEQPRGLSVRHALSGSTIAFASGGGRAVNRIDLSSPSPQAVRAVPPRAPDHRRRTRRRCLSLLGSTGVLRAHLCRATGDRRAVGHEPRGRADTGTSRSG